MKKLNLVFGILLLVLCLTHTMMYDEQTIDVSIAGIENRIDAVNDAVNDAVSDGTNVTVTMYNAVVSQCDSDPLITAGMYKINPKKATEHKWVALSRNLLVRWGGNYNYGDKIEIIGIGDRDGVYTVVDTMNDRFTNRVDILETVGTSLYKFDEVVITKI